MSDPRYRHAHQTERKRLAPIVEAGLAYCAEPRCLWVEAGRTRWIPPGAPWQLSHTPDGLRYIGPSHAKCNSSEAAIRGNRARAKRRRRWVIA